MRQNLLASIKSEKELGSAIILTHNIDFIFLQLVVLPALKAAGQPKLTIFTDALCAADTFESQAPLIGGIGVNYRVVPVAMPQGFRFHPKAILLSGNENAKLLIGSGNLTYGGWIENAEIWSELDATRDGTAQFAWFYNYLSEIAQSIPFPETIVSEVNEAFDAQNHRWAIDLASPDGLVGVMGNRFPPLVDQFADHLGTEMPVNRITVCAPYFDKTTNALKALSKRFGNPPVRVFVQNGRSTLCSAAAKTLSPNIELIPIHFKRASKDGGERESFVHAKYFAFKRSGNVTVFSGSANCSDAALTLAGHRGNAELMLIQELTDDGFTDQFMNDIEFGDESLSLSDPVEDEDDNHESDSITITAARLEDDGLYIGYKAGTDFDLKNCLVDDNPVEFKIIDPGELVASCNWPARFVRLKCEKDHREVFSNLCWVDHESQLGVTASGRWLVDTIGRKSRDGYWGLGAWAEIMDAFGKHLQYIPAQVRPTRSKKKPDDDNQEREYTESDVFSSHYGLGSLSIAERGITKASSAKAVKDLLLKWFGCASNGPDSPEDPDLDRESQKAGLPPSDGEDAVDVPENIVCPVDPVEEKDASVEDSARINKFLVQLIERICSVDYLENRPLNMMASDLKLIAVILLIGRREKWLSWEDFIKYTKLIWNQLFLSTDRDCGRGWIEHRKLNTDSEEDPVEMMRSPELSAVLAAWSLSIPLDFSTAERTSFNLCCIMSVARLPELWLGGPLDQIAEKLEAELLPVVPAETYDPEHPELFEKKWKMVMRLGCSVKELERTLGDAQPAELKDRVDWSKIPAGTLLWQGVNGFYVTVEPVVRTQHNMANVITLDGAQLASQIQPEFLIPMKTLISPTCGICDSKLDENHRKYLNALANSIRKGINSGGKAWLETAAV